jgi:N-acetylmuramic acid 6-phosphate etherase
MLTEQPNPNTLHIDQLDALGILQAINREDRTVAEVVAAALPQIAQAVEAITARMGAGGRLIYMGAGTSGRLGVLDAVECVPTYGTPPGLVVGLLAGGERALIQPVEGSEDDEAAGRADLMALGLGPNDALVGIAASGRTPYVLSGMRYAAEVGAARIGIACNAPSPLLDSVEVAIPLVVGPEVIAGSTRMKAGSAQKMALNMLSMATMIRLGKVYGNLMVDVQPTNLKLEARARGLVMRIAGVDEARAADLLAQAGRSVKLAIVMAKRGVDAEAGRALLAAAGGRLRDVIG